MKDLPESTTFIKAQCKKDFYSIKVTTKLAKVNELDLCFALKR